MMMMMMMIIILNEMCPLYILLSVTVFHICSSFKPGFHYPS